MTRLEVRVHADDLPGGRWERALAAGQAAALPGSAGLVRWLAGARPAVPGDQLRLDGRRLTRRSPAARVRAGLVVIGDPPLAPAVSVEDHLAAATSPSAARALLATVPHLSGRGRDRAGVLSGGERRLLGWARALLLRPAAVVLDGATTGLDAEALAWATAQVERWRADGAVALVRAARAEEAAWVTADG